ncbi:MAG TPA: response regulator, partial [Pirellulales bacterium]
MSNARVPTEHATQNNGKGSAQATLERSTDQDLSTVAPVELAPAVVLVIDDDRAVRHTIRRIFEETQLEILTAESAEEGLKVASQRHPDVILLDVMLP